MKKLITIILTFILVGTLVGCNQSKNTEEKNSDKKTDLEKITVVLDWTPTTNHTGLYAALANGYFEEEGLDVTLVQPPDGGADSLVASGEAQFGISFQDSLAPAFTADETLPVTAVAAILQHNTSGIISLKEDGISSPKGMENKVYATWESPVEQAMIKNVVEADNGDYSKVELLPTYVTDVVSGLQTDVDAVWIFYGWDGIATELAGLDTNYFYFKDINPVFDYYSPVIIGNNEYLKSNKNESEAFLRACKKGYEYAIANPDESAKILVDQVPELDIKLITASQEWLSSQYQAEASSWGVIDEERWDNFYQWLYDNKLIEKEIPEGYGFSNDYLEQ